MGNNAQPQKKTALTRKYIYSGVSLNNGAPNLFGGAVPFPFGEVYHTLWLDFYISLTIGSGSSAITEGELGIIKNIYIKSDKHDVVVNACGRMLFYRAKRVMGTTPYKDAMAASTAVYKVSLPIHFADKTNRRPEDTALDMANVSSFEVTISMGTVADLLGTPGTASVAVTMNATIEKSIFASDSSNAPIMKPYIVDLPPVDPSVLQYFEFEKTQNLGMMQLLIMTTNSATAGLKASGTLANTIISNWSFEDNIRQLFQKISADNIQFDNKDKYQMEAIPTGVYIIEFSRDDSVWSAYPNGGKSRVNLNWTNGTLSTSQVTCLIDGIKKL